MIFGQFGDKATRAMSEAKRYAIELRQRFMAPEHIVLGLLSIPEDVPPAVAERISLEDAKHWLMEHSEPAVNPAQQERATMTPRARRVLEQAVLESRRFGTTFVGTMHLWLGVLADTGDVSRMLRVFGVDVDAAREQINQRLRETSQGKEV